MRQLGIWRSCATTVEGAGPAFAKVMNAPPINTNAQEIKVFNIIQGPTVMQVRACSP
jgi:hypothetical protein